MLATLDPSVLKDDANTEYNPFNSWGPGRMSVGGGANFSNDLQVDGSRVGISVKTGYVPTPDMVQEVIVKGTPVADAVKKTHDAMVEVFKARGAST